MKRPKWRRWIPLFLSLSILLSGCLGVDNEVRIRCGSGLADISSTVTLDFEDAQYPEIYPEVGAQVQALVESYSIKGGTWTWRQTSVSGKDMAWEITGRDVPIEHIQLAGMQTSVTYEGTGSDQIITIKAIVDGSFVEEAKQRNPTQDEFRFELKLSITGVDIVNSNAGSISENNKDSAADDVANWTGMDSNDEAWIQIKEVCPVNFMQWIYGFVIIAYGTAFFFRMRSNSNERILWRSAFKDLNRAFILKWISLTILGLVVGGIVSLVLDFRFLHPCLVFGCTPPTEQERFLSYLLTGLCVGGGIAFGQWLLMRKHLPLWNSILWAIGIPVGMGIAAALYGLYEYFPLAFLFPVITGLWQTAALEGRPQIFKPWFLSNFAWLVFLPALSPGGIFPVILIAVFGGLTTGIGMNAFINSRQPDPKK